MFSCRIFPELSNSVQMEMEIIGGNGVTFIFNIIWFYSRYYHHQTCFIQIYSSSFKGKEEI